jgi:hypothetical protein
MNWKDRYYQYSIYFFRFLGFLISLLVIYITSIEWNFWLPSPFPDRYIKYINFSILFLLLVTLTFLFGQILYNFLGRDFIETPRSSFLATGDFYDPSSRTGSGSDDIHLVAQEKKIKKMRFFYTSFKEKNNV